MFYQAKPSRWSPRFVSYFAVVAFLVLMIFNKSEWKVRFLDWGLGTLVVALMFLFFLMRGRVSKREAWVIGIPLAWMGYALLLTPFAHSAVHHLAALLQVFILTLMASLVVIALFTREKLMSQATLITVGLWVAISLVLFVLWNLGILTYEKRDFSGLFGNRNEFAVQTVILMGMLLFFVRGHELIKAAIIALCFVLVVSTLSTKGFLFFFFVLFFPLYLKARLHKKILVMLVAILFFSAAYAALPNIQDRITRFTMVFTSPDDLRQSESAFLRAWLMVEGSKLIVENPVTGVGVDNARYILIPPLAQERNADEGLYSHNNYVEMALNAGIVGLLLFYLPLIYIYFKTKNTHPYWVALKTFTALYLVMGVGMIQYNNFISIFVYCLIIFLYLYHKESVAYDQNSLHCQHP